jgi:hypothetical protein
MTLLATTGRVAMRPLLGVSVAAAGGAGHLGAGAGGVGPAPAHWHRVPPGAAGRLAARRVAAAGAARLAGAVYASAPFMAWMSLHTGLSAQLERCRRTERLRERASRVGSYVGVTAGLAAAAG